MICITWWLNQFKSKLQIGFCRNKELQLSETLEKLNAVGCTMLVHSVCPGKDGHTHFTCENKIFLLSSQLFWLLRIYWLLTLLFECLPLICIQVYDFTVVKERRKNSIIRLHFVRAPFLEYHEVSSQIIDKYIPWTSNSTWASSLM